MNVETANRLQLLRKKNNLSQEELAEKIGISRQAVSKWERAEASPDTDNLILLAKLYGVTLDELLRTESTPMPNSEGISLRKEDYSSNSQPIEDDGEIYPNGHNFNNTTSASQGACGQPFSNSTEQSGSYNAFDESTSANNDNNSAKTENTTASFIKTVADFTATVTKEALGATAKALSEANEGIKSGMNFEKSFENSFEKHFENFGDKFEDMDTKFDKFDEKLDQNISKAVDNQCANYDSSDNNYKNKQPATLLDKLFPLLIGCLFLCLLPFRLAHPGWMLFLTIPIYYIWTDSIRRFKGGSISFAKAVERFVDGSLPILVTILFFVSGFLFGFWHIIWTLFLLIPIYYTGKEAIKKRNLILFCYPVVVVWVYLMFGLVFGNWLFGLPLFITIPFYYIILDHIKKK